MSLETTAFTDLGIAVFRIVVGAVFLAHAVPKLEDPEATQEFFESVGLHGSPWFLYLALGIEIMAGTLLAIGLYTQMAALILTVYMGIATNIAIGKMDKKFEGGYEVDLLLLAASFMFYLMGGGKYALDAIL